MEKDRLAVFENRKDDWMTGKQEPASPVLFLKDTGTDERLMAEGLREMLLGRSRVRKECDSESLECFGLDAPAGEILDGLRGEWPTELEQAFVDLRRRRPSFLATRLSRARPDFILASSDILLDESTIRDLTECKCCKTVDTKLIRSEYGKARDLRVLSYSIVSYHRCSTKLLIGARNLGLSLIRFGLATDKREEYLAGEADLGVDLAEQLAKARSERLFLKAMEEMTQEMEEIRRVQRRKLLSSENP